MATIVELLNTFDHKSKEYHEFLQDLISENGDIPLNVEEIDKVQSTFLTTVNSRLNQSNTRYSGLLILEKILPQCSKDVLCKYCILWIAKAIQVLESIHSSTRELTLSCKVIGTIIIQSKDIGEVQKQISVQYVKQLVGVIDNIDSERISGAIYYLIAVLLHRYPEVCERLQVPIRKIILAQVDSTQHNLVKASSNCYTLLAKATSRLFKPPAEKLTYTGWLYNQALICNSLHAIMDELFSNLTELETIDIWDKLELPSISQKNLIQFYSEQQQRFQNLCFYLSSMLRGCEKKNSVSPHDILRVLCRGLAIQPTNLKNRNSFKEQMLYLVLPKLHTALLTVLDAFIVGFKEQLIPYGSTVLQLIHQTLQWTETVLENQTTINGGKPFKTVRISIYKSLSSWLTNTSLLSGVETIADECLSCILKDIVPERDRVLLTIQKTKNLSKKGLKRLRDSQYEKGAYLTNGPVSKKEFSLDVNVCKEALISLQNIFYSGGSWLKQAFFKTTQNVVIPLLYDCYLSCSELKFYKENAECRLELLRVLRALQMNPHSLTPPPTQYSIEIFEMALNDVHFEIIQEGKRTLVELDKVVHPSALTLQLTQVEEIHKELIANNQNKEYTATIEDTNAVGDENIIDKDVEPSSNKKLKVMNSVESVSENTIIETETTIPIQDEYVSETEQVDTSVSVDKTFDNVESMQPVNDTTSLMEPVSSSNIVIENESENNSIDHCWTALKEKIAKASKPSQKSETAENIGEEEIMQLFHDVPRDWE